MNKSLLYIFLLLCSFACSKEIDIDLPDYDSEVTVDGWIINNSSANIALTESYPYLEDLDSASIMNSIIKDASITLSTSEGESEVLTLTYNSKYFPPYIYKSNEIYGKPGETYAIDIKINNETITSETTITSSPTFDSVATVITSDTTRQFIVYVDDNPDEDNYYYIEIYVEGQDNNYHPASSPVYTDNGQNGETIALNVYHSNQPDPLDLYNPAVKRNLPDYEFYIGDTVNIRASSLDEDAYEVLYYLYLDQINSGNPFSFIDNATTTNITGGIGRWTGMASQTFRMKGLDQND